MQFHEISRNYTPFIPDFTKSHSYTLDLKLVTKIGLSRWCRVKARLHVGSKDYENYPERLMEQELAHREHLSSVARKPWDEVRPDSVLPKRWDDELGPRM